MSEPKRDRWGRPLIVPPDGGKAVAYTRVTTLAKTLEDEGGLSKWMMRMTALGLVKRSDLYARVATAGDDKGVLDRLCEEAKEAAGGSHRANLGTALHAATEAVDKGLAEGDITLAMFAADLAAYSAALVEHGLGVDVDHIERFVVLDDWQVAGTFDRLFAYEGRLVIGDLKTGADLKYSWRSIAVQLAAYAHADWYYDADTDARSPMPEVDQSVGLVVHLPAGSGTCTVHEVDLDAGWHAAQQSMWCRHWRKQNVSRPASKTATVEQPPTAAPVAPEVGMAKIPTSIQIPGTHTLVDTRADRRQRLRDRILWQVGQRSDFRDHLVRQWPTGVPGLATEHRHTDIEMDGIEAAIVATEALLDSPFAPVPASPNSPGEGTPAPRHLVPGVNAVSMGGEGVPPAQADPFDGLNGEAPTLVDAVTCAAYVARLTALPSDLVAVVEDPCKAVGVPNLRSGTATTDHLAVVEQHLAPAEIVHAERLNRLAAIRDEQKMSDGEMEVLAGLASGGKHTLAKLTEADLDRFDALFQAMGDGLMVTFDADGCMVISAEQSRLEARLVEGLGSKAAALAVAKTVAAELDAKVPRSVAALATDKHLSLALGVLAAAH